MITAHHWSVTAGRLVSAVALFSASFSFGLSSALAVGTPETSTYPAQSSFNATQGTGNWYNMKKTGATYSYLSQYTAGPPARWNEASGFPYVRDAFFHPENTADAVKKWVAPRSGNIGISGTVFRVNAASNGVVAKIFKNTTQLWSATITPSADVVPSGVADIHVDTGDAIYFVVNANGSMSSDETNWSPVITLTTALKIEAESFSSSSGTTTSATGDTGGGQQIGSFDAGDYLVYSNVNLSGGYKTLEARVASAATGNKFEVRLDSATGTVINTFAIAATGSYSTYETQTWALTGAATGTHNLYVKAVLGSGVADINWFRFTNSQPRGATMPFKTYEAESGTYGSGASLNDDATVKEASSGKSYVNLNGTGEYVQWSNVRDANRLLLRFSVPQGASGTLALYVNGAKRQDISLSSTYNYDSGDPTAPRRFDDKDVAIDIQAGDTVKLQKDASSTLAWYGIDLIDLETAPPPLTIPANYISVKDAPYNAVGNGVADDTSAIQSAVNAASAQGKEVWFPPGLYLQSARINVPSGVNIQGAGIWYTHLHATVTNAVWGGYVGFTLNSGTTVSDLRVSGVETQRDGETSIVILTNAGAGQNIVVQNLWVEHVGGFEGWNDWDYSTIQDVRIRNTYFDGIHWGDRGNSYNLAQNNHIRGSGDDGIAQVNQTTWSLAHDNLAQFNTISATYWGRGMSDVGGNNLTYRDNIIDSSYNAGMIITTEQLDTPTFAINGLKFQRNTLNKAGHAGHNHAGIHFWLSVNPMQGVRIELNEVLNGETEGIHIDNTSYGDSAGRTQLNFNTAAGNTLGNYSNASTLIVPVLNSNTGF